MASQVHALSSPIPYVCKELRGSESFDVEIWASYRWPAFQIIKIIGRQCLWSVLICCRWPCNPLMVCLRCGPFKDVGCERPVHRSDFIIPAYPYTHFNYLDRRLEHGWSCRQSVPNCKRAIWANLQETRCVTREINGARVCRYRNNTSKKCGTINPAPMAVCVRKSHQINATGHRNVLHIEQSTPVPQDKREYER